MNILLYISLSLFTFLSPAKKLPPQGIDICKLYGTIYIEKESRNRADISVYVDKEDAFVNTKVFVQENEFYADRPGMWYFTEDRYLADYIIFFEKEEGRTRHVIAFTDTESQAGCR